MMLRPLSLLALTLLGTLTVNADPVAVNRARNSLTDLLRTATDLAKEAQRDAEILRLLREAGRSLDDWQQNTAISKALDHIAKADQLAAQPPFSPRVRQAVMVAKNVVEPAKTSSANTDLSKIRSQLQGRPIDMMRTVVAEEIGALAALASQVSDVSGVLTKSVAAATATTLGTKGE